MSRKKGDKKTGGRQKGAPNKVTSDLKGWILKIIEGNRAQFKRDLKSLDSKDRLVIIERLIQYVVPKQQSISLEAQIQAEYAELEKFLLTAPDEVVERLAERVLSLKELSKDSDE
jgi:hypothetical protein